MTDTDHIQQSLVNNVAASSGVPPQQVEAVLKSLGLDDLSDRIATAFGTNFDAKKIGGMEVSARYDKMMIVK